MNSHDPNNPKNLGTPKQIVLNPDQILAGFIMQLGGMLAVTQQHVPPQMLARQLTMIASKLLAMINDMEARVSVTAQIANEFKLSVETQAIVMRAAMGPGMPVPHGG